MPPKDKSQEEEDPEIKKIEGEEEEDPEKEVSDPQEDEDEEDGLSIEELRARLKAKEERLREVNRESKERRLALEKLEKEKKDREEAELSEKEKAEKRAQEAEDNLAALRNENRSLKLSTRLASTVKELKLDFASDQAREDAIRFLDLEKLGEDFEGLEDQLKAMSKTRAYLFGKPDPTQFTSDGARKGTKNQRVSTQQALNNKRRLISPL